MRFPLYKTLIFGLLLAILGLGVASAEVPVTEANKNLTDKIGVFRAVGPANVPAQRPNDEERLSYTVRRYKAASGNLYLVEISQTRTDGAAYSLVTSTLKADDEVKVGLAGSAGLAHPRRILFSKGVNFISVFAENDGGSGDELLELARALAQQLDGENEIPVLVKHLPQFEKIGLGARYAVTTNKLKALIPNQAVLDAVSFDGGAEAVVARYDSGTLAIIEFNTPQIASTNNYNIVAKINELRAGIPPPGTPGTPGTSLPTAYRRVGNYSVFVFDAPSEAAANQLIDQVKYQQVVQWLGENPFAYEAATREFTETTLGVLVAVVKASGLAAVACIAIGGIFGALLFSRRRKQQRAAEAYADSNAMLRLNLDDLTRENDPGRLIGSGR